MANYKVTKATTTYFSCSSDQSLECPIWYDDRFKAIREGKGETTHFLLLLLLLLDFHNLAVTERTNGKGSIPDTMERIRRFCAVTTAAVNESRICGIARAWDFQGSRATTGKNKERSFIVCQSRHTLTPHAAIGRCCV
jgi:hypothetical protein